jgi:hypothetical protein
MDKYDLFFNLSHLDLDEFFSDKFNLRLYLQKRKLVHQIGENTDHISMAQIARFYQYLMSSFNIVERDISCGEGFFLNGMLLTKCRWNNYPIYPGGHDLLITFFPVSNAERYELIQRYPFIVEKDKFEDLLIKSIDSKKSNQIKL